MAVMVALGARAERRLAVVASVERVRATMATGMEMAVVGAAAAKVVAATGWAAEKDVERAVVVAARRDSE